MTSVPSAAKFQQESAAESKEDDFEFEIDSRELASRIRGLGTQSERSIW